MTRIAHAVPFIALVRDAAPGRVELARDGGVTVRYRPGTRERALLRLAAVELARIHRAAGAQRIVPLVTPPLEWSAGQPFEPWLDALRDRPITPNRVLLFSGPPAARRAGSARTRGRASRTPTARSTGCAACG